MGCGYVVCRVVGEGSCLSKQMIAPSVSLLDNLTIFRDPADLIFLRNLQA
jgi:hypothetical protein